MYRKVTSSSIVGIMSSVSALAGGGGTEWTYQGNLKLSGDPLNASADFICTLWDADTNGDMIGDAVAIDDVAIVDGLFSVNLDFADAFDGESRWLEISVRSPAGGGEFTTLSPRQAVTPAPYALFALAGNEGPTGPPGPPGTGAVWELNGSNAYYSAGKVGIGTDDPWTPLHVANANPYFTLHDTDSTGAEQEGFLSFVDSNATETAWLGFVRNTNFYVRNNIGNTILRNDNGAVGIGTDDPVTPLHVASAGRVAITLHDTNSSGPEQEGFLSFVDSNATETAWLGFVGNTNFYVRNNIGNVIFRNDAGAVGIGTDSPVDELHVKGNGGVIAIEGSNHAYVEYYPDGAGAGRKAYVGFGSATNDDFTIQNEISGQDIRLLTTGGGATRVNILEIEGADLAERFPTSDRVEPGMVVAIDPANPGQLCLARGSYNRGVAGIVSGANGFSVGAVLGNLPGHEDAPPVALSGRVYVYCDSTEHAIQPTDLLTTSDTPGHAMKVTDYARAQGAVIGKAMTGLERGKTGLVLVLVSLQ